MGLRWSGFNGLLIIYCVLLFIGCEYTTPYRIDESKTPAQKNGVAKEEVTQTSEVSASKTKPVDEIQKKESQPPEDDIKPPKDKRSTSSKDTIKIISPKTSQMTNQESLDSALEFCQVSNDFWERGDLDNALDALDKAYSLILKVNQDDDPEVLQQKEDLRVTIAKRIIEVYASRFTAVNGHHKAIPLVMNGHVMSALQLLKGNEKNFFLAAYRRSGKYRPAIIKALKEAGLPQELSWLPLIESGFKVRAFSSARALGLWQFIASTGYKFGLGRDPWIDERMDPEKSTKAAIGYLKELHQIFGDWTTVLAAYNCGERRVLNLIRKQKINYLDNFWDLYEQLPRETAFYVPRFLAVLHILNNPKAHDVTLPPFDSEMEIEEVTINKQVHLKTIAKDLDMEYSVLRDLNPELRQNLTPQTPYALKVPLGKGEILIAKLKDIPVWQPPVPSHIMHRVQTGESLSIIAIKYKTSIRAIMATNGLKGKDYLKVGWRLKIPTGKGVTSSGERPLIYAAKPKEELTEYVVKKGDSLWQIANRFDTTAQTIRSLNRLESSRLQIGQVLRIAKAQASSKPNNTREYRVRKGDSPYLIAKKHQMNLAQFLKVNNMSLRSTIFPGQVVQIKVD